MTTKTPPVLRLMTYEQWLEANPDMAKKEPKREPCPDCCDKWGNPILRDKFAEACQTCWGKQTVIVGPYHIYKAQAKRDMARLTRAGIAFVEVEV